MLLVFPGNRSLSLDRLVVALDKGSEKSGMEKVKLGDVALG